MGCARLGYMLCMVVVLWLFWKVYECCDWINIYGYIAICEVSKV